MECNDIQKKVAYIRSLTLLEELLHKNLLTDKEIQSIKKDLMTMYNIKA